MGDNNCLGPWVAIYAESLPWSRSRFHVIWCTIPFFQQQNNDNPVCLIDSRRGIFSSFGDNLHDGTETSQTGYDDKETKHHYQMTNHHNQDATILKVCCNTKDDNRYRIWCWKDTEGSKSNSPNFWEHRHSIAQQDSYNTL